MEEAGTTGQRMLDPVERASEAIFGVLMAVAIMGSLGVASAGRQEVRATLIMALGCNLAWGITDAVMYLLGAAVERRRRITLRRRLRETSDPGVAHRMVAAALSLHLDGEVRQATVEELRKDLVAMPLPRAGLAARDLLAALGVFVLVVLATFPVVIPYVFVQDLAAARQASNALAVGVLYGYGHVLGRYSGARPWHYGVIVAALGVVLVGIIRALGG